MVGRLVIKEDKSDRILWKWGQNLWMKFDNGNQENLLTIKKNFHYNKFSGTAHSFGEQKKIFRNKDTGPWIQRWNNKIWKNALSLVAHIGAAVETAKTKSKRRDNPLPAGLLKFVWTGVQILQRIHSFAEFLEPVTVCLQGRDRFPTVINHFGFAEESWFSRGQYSDKVTVFPWLMDLLYRHRSLKKWRGESFTQRSSPRASPRASNGCAKLPFSTKPTGAARLICIRVHGFVIPLAKTYVFWSRFKSQPCHFLFEKSA